MRENLNAIKRLVAFTLTVLLLGTTIWNDVFVIATEENHCSEYVDEQTYAANILQPVGEGDGYCDYCGQVEQAHVHVEEEPVVEEDAAVEEVQPAEELPAEEPVEDTSVPEEPQPEIENTEYTVSENVEEITPEDTPVVENIDGEETPEDIEESEEEKNDNEEEKAECEHEWTYTSNGDGTHVKKCSKCDEKITEDCTFDEEGKCVHCGYEQKEECEHEWEYISNENGTHIKRCKICGEEVEETCQLDENGICHDCLYEDERLMYQEFSKTLFGTTVKVSGDLPRGARVDIFYAGTRPVEEIINENTDETNFTAFVAFDIDIYRRGGEKYQPQEDGGSVQVSFMGVEEVEQLSQEDVSVYRIEDDNQTVTEIECEVSGEEVRFDADHFSIYVYGNSSQSNVSTKTLEYYEHFSYINKTSSTEDYSRLKEVLFYLYFESTGTVDLSVDTYKNLTSATNPTSGTKLYENETKSVSGTAGEYVEVKLDYGETADAPSTAFLTKDTYYSVVVKVTNQVPCAVVYGQGSSPLLKSYIFNTYNEWSNNSGAYDGIFQEKVSPDDPTDTYDITSIVDSKNNEMLAVSGYKFYYGLNDTETFTATINNDSTIERAIKWTSDDLSVVEIVSSSANKATIKAVGSGTTVLRAKYGNNTEKKININVIEFKIGNKAIDGCTVDYTGSAISSSDIKGYIGADAVTTLTAVVDGDGSVDDAAEVRLTFTSPTDSSYKKTWTKYYKIKPLELTEQVFYLDNNSDDKNDLPIKFTITGGEITNMTGMATISADGVNGTVAVQPKYNASTQDFSAIIEKTTVSAGGLVYTIAISGVNNFTGSFSVDLVNNDSSAIIDIKTLLKPRLRGSTLVNPTYKGSAFSLTDRMDGTVNKGYNEVEFVGNDEIVRDEIITSETADYTITDVATGKTATSADDSPATTAGQKRITFTMKDGSGYKGSVSTTFTVVPVSMNSSDITVDPSAISVRNGVNNNVPKAGEDFVVKFKGTAIDTSQYSIECTGNTGITNAAKLLITGNTNFKDTRTETFSVVANYLSDLEVFFDEDGGYTVKGDKNYDFSKVGYSRTYDPTLDVDTVKDRIKVYVPGRNPSELTEGTHYEIAVTDEGTNTFSADVGTKTITITPSDDIKTYYNITGDGIVKATFKVVERTISSSAIQVDYTAPIGKTYTGSAIELTTAASSTDTGRNLKLTYLAKSYILKPGIDYDINYNGTNVNAGTAKFSIVGKGNFTGTSSQTKYKFTIGKATLTDSMVSFPANMIYTYDGTAKEPVMTVKIGENSINEFTDDTNTVRNYTVKYDNNIAATTDTKKATVTILAGTNGTDGQNLTGKVVKTFDISPKNVTFKSIVIGGEGGATATIQNSAKNLWICPDLNVVYSGSVYRGSVAVYIEDNGKAVKLNGDTDYYVTYSTNYNVRDYNLFDDTTIAASPYIQITGRGNYAGSNAKVLYHIKPVVITENDEKLLVDGQKAELWKKAYDWNNGSDVNVSVTSITYNGKTLVAGTDYDLDVPTDYSAGEKTAHIKFKNNYSYADANGYPLPYTIGIDVNDTKVVSLTNHYNSADTAYCSTKGTGYKVRWTNSHAPKMELHWQRVDNADVSVTFDGGDSDNPTVPNTTSPYVTSGINIVDVASNTSINKYDSRAAGDTGSTYNTITVTLSAAKGAGGLYTGEFYGEKVITYEIAPVSLSETKNFVSYPAGFAGIKYTGAEIIPTIEPEYTYGYADDGNGGTTPLKYTVKKTTNSGSKDFTLNPDTIGPNVGSYPRTLTGCGNFDESQSYTFRVEKGDVKLFLKPTTGANKGSEVPLTDFTTDDSGSATTPRQMSVTIDPAQETYIYKSGNEYKPTFILKDSSGNLLVEGTDYNTISYNRYDTHTTTEDPSTAVISIPSTGNFINTVITVKYVIQTNDINQSTYTVALDDLPYAQKVYRADVIKDMVKANKNLLTVKAGGTLLNFAENESDTNGDYIIITDATDPELAAWRAKNVNADLFGVNSLPSYSSTVDASDNYIFIKGINAYSGVRKVPFNVVLNLNETSIVTVNTNAAKYNLDANGENPTDVNDSSVAFKAVIKYKDLTGTYVELTGDNNYTITRSRDKLPGPDANITVKGKNACKGQRTNVCPVGSSDPPIFLVDLGVYKGISIKGGTVYHYTGSPIEIRFNGLEDAEYNSAIDSRDGDYSIVYTENPSQVNTQTAHTEAGKWYAIIKATDNSKYFKKGSYSNAETKENYAFYIKYYLPDAVFSFTGGSVVSHTGSTITIPAVIKTADGKHDLYDYSDPSKNTLVKLDRTTATDMGTYNIVASAKDAAAETYVEGTLTGTFKVSGSAIGDDNVALKDPNQANVIFKGSAFTPEVVVTVSGRSTPLTKDVDYTVEYMNNVHVGKATVLVKGKNNYEGTGTVHFNISAANISACDITPEDAYFSGYFINQSDQREVVPVETEVTVKNGTYTLTKDSEYTLSYNLHNMGITDSAEVTVTAAGNDFTGSKKVTYKILPLDLGDTSKVTVKQGTTTTEYTGSAVDPRDTVKVIVGDGYLCSNKEDTTTYDYTITISDGAGGDNLPSIKERGTYYLVITGAHNCTGSTAVPFIITEKSLPNNWHYFYSTPDFVGSKPVYHSNVPEGETPYYDYTPNYTFTDANGNSKSDTIRIVIHDVPTLTAEEANPVLQIFDTAISTTTPLTLGTDYEIKNPKNNTKAGTAAWYRGDGIDSTHAKPTDDAPQLTISGLGNYSGEITIPYNIGKNINNLEGLEVEYTFNGQTLTYNDENKDSGNNEDGTLLTTTYNGAEQKPTAKVYLNKGTEKQLLYPTKDYELTFENANTGEEDDSITAGYKNIVITGIGTYCGKISQRYTIKKKAITTSHNTFTTEELSVRDNGKEVVAMEIKGTILSRIPTVAKAKELLYPDLIANEDDCSKYVGYFYAVYDGKPVKPELGKDIFVYDRTLSSEALTDEIDPKDLEIDYNGKSDTVASFEDGELINYSEMTIKFAQDKTDYVTNYFATGNDAGGTSSTSYTIRYLILQRDVSTFTVEYDNGLDDKQYKYDEGRVKTPSLTVRSGDQILTKDVDYEIAKAKDADGVYYDMASPGEQKVLVKGINHYRGEIEVTYYIWGDLSNTNAYDSDMSNGYSSVPVQIYTGVGPSVSDELTIALVLLKQNAQKKDIVLTKGTHYSLKSDYSDDHFFYTGEVTYKGNENKYWTGEKTIKYFINFDENKVKPTCDGTKEKYTSYPIRPEIKLNVSTAEFDESNIKYYRDTNGDGIGDVQISEDEDFIEPGYITVEVPYQIGGKAARKPATGTYQIIPRPMVDCELVVSSRYRYTGSMIKPNVIVFINPKDGNDIRTLVEGTDYDVTYGGTNIDNIKNVGKVTVTGKTDKITGKMSKTFSIDVGQVAGLTATPVEGSSNSIKATWVKDIFSSGAELMLYKMSGSMATAVKINDTNNYTVSVSGNTTAYVFENLENVTNYKIAVRSYIDGTEKMYSEYSYAYATTGISTTSVEVTQPSANMVTITWDDTGNAMIYKIYRYKDSEGKASAKKLASYPASTEGYTNIVDEPGVYWYYIVGYTILDGELKPTQESEHKKVTISL
ncbi:hypothetical protein NXH64_06530 [Butyrivibrio fibrisolvens]|uniref:hypothetical protein n=1 Tax=Pseudobutyrivibrio ruminis TaxID=46206 RepID=UPI000407C9B0|nr:hypothetical protein [Pseudobutyrivibrio ruminis]MDC7279163.1 hypothetical protein [Butyrivibrio fibrisolvens]